MSQTFKDLTLITLVLTILFGFMLGSRPLSIPDEGRYVEIPREMAVTGDYVTPRLNGVKYFEKPVLFYWLQSFMVKTFGINEWAMRALPALFGLLGCLFTYFACAYIWGRQTGLLSTAVLATSTLYYAHTRIIILDLAVSVFVSIALFSFLLALREKERRRKILFGSFFFICCGGAVLTKGLLGLAVPGMTILIYAIIFKRWDALKLAFNPFGIALFLILVLPWHIMAILRNPNFFDFYIIHEHFTRFLDDAHGRTQPFWFFIPILILGLFPWMFFGYQSIVRVFKDKSETFQAEIFLLIWITFTFVFFSFGKSKLIPYIVPVFPACAALIGIYLTKIWNNEIDTKTFKRGAIGYIIFNILLIPAIWIALSFLHIKEDNEVLPYALFLTGVLGFSAHKVYKFMNMPRRQIIMIAANMCVFMWTLNAAWPFFDRPSIKPIAAIINAHKQPGDEIIGYHRYFQDLPPYINQTIKVVNWDGELKHGMKWEDTSAWMINETDFWNYWNSETRVFAVMRNESYEQLKERNVKNLYFQKKFGRNVLVTNQQLD